MLLTNVGERKVITEVPVAMYIILMSQLWLATVTRRPAHSMESVRFLIQLLFYDNVVCGIKVIVNSWVWSVSEMSGVLVCDTVCRAAHHHTHPSQRMCQTFSQPGYIARTVFISQQDRLEIQRLGLCLQTVRVVHLLLIHNLINIFWFVLRQQCKSK